MPGRQILDAAITTHEVIHSMEKNRQPGMAFKLDISKAYDKVNWDFLHDVLERIGFSNRIINLIMTMVGSVQYSVLLNGSPWGNFAAEKGLRQGDPLSPYLFIMVAEVLGRSFYKLVSMDCVKGVEPATTTETKVIQKFVDDTFLFGESSVMEEEAWKMILHNYKEILG